MAGAGAGAQRAHGDARRAAGAGPAGGPAGAAVRVHARSAGRPGAAGLGADRLRLRALLGGLRGAGEPRDAGRGRPASLLVLDAAVHLGDVGAGALGHPAADVPVLGGHHRLLVGAHRLLRPRARRARGRAQGAAHDGGRRSGAVRRPAGPAGAHALGRLRRLRPPARRGAGRGGPAVRAAAARGLGQVGAGALPHLAALGDGGAEPGERLPARGLDGERGRVPGAARRAGRRPGRPRSRRSRWPGWSAGWPC